MMAKVNGLVGSQALDCEVPPPFAQPGSFKYGSSHKIIDWIEMRTCSRIG